MALCGQGHIPFFYPRNRPRAGLDGNLPPHHDSICKYSSPQHVAIPTELFRSTEVLMALCKTFHSVSCNLIVDKPVNVFPTSIWKRNIYCCVQNGPHLMVIINKAFIVLNHCNYISSSYYLAIYVIFLRLKKVVSFRRVHTISERDY